MDIRTRRIIEMYDTTINEEGDMADNYSQLLTISFNIFKRKLQLMYKL